MLAGKIGQRIHAEQRPAARAQATTKPAGQQKQKQAVTQRTPWRVVKFGQLWFAVDQIGKVRVQIVFAVPRRPPPPARTESARRSVRRSSRAAPKRSAASRPAAARQSGRCRSALRRRWRRGTTANGDSSRKTCMGTPHTWLSLPFAPARAHRPPDRRPRRWAGQLRRTAAPGWRRADRRRAGAAARSGIHAQPARISSARASASGNCARNRRSQAAAVVFQLHRLHAHQRQPFGDWPDNSASASTSGKSAGLRRLIFGGEIGRHRYHRRHKHRQLARHARLAPMASRISNDWPPAQSAIAPAPGSAAIHQLGLGRPLPACVPGLYRTPKPPIGPQQVARCPE